MKPTVARSTARRAGSRSARRIRGTTVALIAVGALVIGGGAAAAVTASGVFSKAKVGQSDARGVLLPSNQWVKPLGERTLVTNGRLLSSVLSPDGGHVAALSYEHGIGFLTVLDAKAGTVLQQIGTGVGADAELGDSTVAADGPYYSPDGKTLWFSQTADLLRFTVESRRHGYAEPGQDRAG